MNTLLTEAKKLEQEIIANRRYLHENPECGFDLSNTCKFVMEKLSSYGYNPKLICESGIVATIGKEGGKTILLRADMDALPMEETTDLPFRSKYKMAHTCGHDAHTAMLLGAAKLLKQHENELEGCVKLMFQPNEESTSPNNINGSKAMINAGLMENPNVDAAISIHIMSGLFPSGSIVTRKGSFMSSCDRIKIEITGKGSHGSQPHNGIDPINIALHVYEGLQNLIAREIALEEQVVITIGSFHSGDAANVMPEKATMSGTMRTTSETTRNRLKKRIEEICYYTCKAYNGSYKLEFLDCIPSVYNNPELTEEIMNYSEELFGYPCELMEFPMSVSDDLSIISHTVPTCYLVLGSGNAEEGYIYPHHNPNILFNEDVFYKGTALYANSAIKWLKNNK